MRPHPHHHHPPGDTGRIIRLGDVRRRRAARTRAPDRHYLASLLLIAAVGWALWLTVLFTLPPARLLTYVAFLAPLWLAVAASGALVAYGIEWKRGLVPSLAVCGRRGALTALLVVLNLAALSAHRWSLPLLIGSVVAVTTVDLLLTRRDRFYG